MADKQLINVAAIPGAELDPDAIDTAATGMRKVGTDVSGQGLTVLTTWQQLSGSYEAPEDETLFAAMNPVKTEAEAFGSEVGKAADALVAYAEDIRPIKAELEAIKTEATTFVAEASQGYRKVSPSVGTGASVDQLAWHEHEPFVEQNQALHDRVNAQVELLSAAQLRCANTILDLVGAPHLQAASETNPGGFGLTDIPDGAEMPWGTPHERTKDCAERIVWDGLIVTTLGGGIQGLVALGGFEANTWKPWEWTHDWGTAGQAWWGVGLTAVGLSTLVVSPLLTRLPGPLGSFYRDANEAVIGAGKGFLNWDLWGEDPLAAFGATAGNVATLFLGGAGGFAAAAKGGTSAARLTLRGADNAASAAAAAAARVSALARTALGTTVGALRRFAGSLDLPAALRLRNGADSFELPVVRRDGTDLDTGNGGGDRSDAPPPRDLDRSSGDPDQTAPDRTPDGTAPDGSRPDPDGRPARNGDGTEGSPVRYEFYNPALDLRGAPEPGLDDLDGLRSKDAYVPGSREHMHAAWAAYDERGGTWGWEKWRDNYIRNQGHHNQGLAFEQLYADRRGIDLSEWNSHNSARGATQVNRHWDLWRTHGQEAFEFKSGVDVKEPQLRMDRALVRDGWTVTYVFGREPSAATIARLERAGIGYEVFYSTPVPVGPGGR